MSSRAAVLTALVAALCLPLLLPAGADAAARARALTVTPSSVHVGEKVTVRAAKAKRKAKTTLLLSRDRRRSADDVLLAASARRKATTKVAVPDIVAPGAWYVLACTKARSCRVASKKLTVVARTTAGKRAVVAPGGTADGDDLDGVPGEDAEADVPAAPAPASLPVANVTAGAAVGEAEGALLTFTVTLSRASATAVKVGWSTADGTAAAPADFAAATGVVTFAPGETSKPVTVLVHDDPVFEEAETVALRIGSPDGATIGAAATASVEIADDDPAPGVAVDSVTVTEGDTGVTQAYFTVDLDRESGVPIAVALATQPGTATAGADFEAVARTITFAPGQRTASFVVPVVGDLVAEPTESFGVTVDGVLAAFGTVTDDD